MTETVEIRYLGKQEKQVFGGTDFEVDYIMTHKKYGRKNEYRVTCTICGIDCHDPHLHVDDVGILGDPQDTNDETLTSDAAGYLFENHI